MTGDGKMIRVEKIPKGLYGGNADMWEVYAIKDGVKNIQTSLSKKDALSIAKSLKIKGYK